MGRFIISRSAAGDRFVLQSENGQTLAVSKTYATLDACKKGIASLIVHAPIMPVRDLTAGESGPNPKCEIVASGAGFAYRVKAANGKVVISSVTYATKKACLRAVAMLRNGVADYEILFERQAGLVPLSMKMPTGAAPRKATPVREKSPHEAEAEHFCEPLFDETEETVPDGIENVLNDVPFEPQDEKATDILQKATVEAKTEPNGGQNKSDLTKKASDEPRSTPEAPHVVEKTPARVAPAAPPAKTQVKEPRLVRLRPDASASRPEDKREPKAPLRRKSIFDVLFKK